MPTRNVFFVLVDGVQVKSNLVRIVLDSIGRTEDEVVEAHVFMSEDDASISSFESKLVLKDGSEIPLDDDYAVFRAAIETVPIVTQRAHPVAWTAPYDGEGIEATKVCLLCMNSPHSPDDDLEQSMAKLRELAMSVSEKGNEGFDADAYRFSDGLFRERGSQPHLILRHILDLSGFAELECLIFDELDCTSRWAFNIAARVVDALSAQPLTNTEPAMVKLCSRLRKEKDPLNVFWDKQLDAILAAVQPAAEHGGGS